MLSRFDAKTGLFIALGLIAIFYVYVVVRGLQRVRAESGAATTPTPGGLATGFVTNFFDTLGIGSYATTTAIFRQPARAARTASTWIVLKRC